LARQFLFALSFLTVFPYSVRIQANDQNILARSAAFFPLVGAVLGLFLAGTDGFLGLFYPPVVSSVIALCFLACLTAGLHLDGLADTVDGLGAVLKYGREKGLEVMRDSRSGSLGIAGLVFLILLKYSLLVSLAPEMRFWGLFLMPVAGRWLLAWSGKLFPYARSTTGLGQGFTGQITYREILLATFWIILLLASEALVSAGLHYGSFSAGLSPFYPAVKLLQAGTTGFFFALAGGLAFARMLARCFGGMTGDTLGAVNEASEVFFLLGLMLIK